MSIPSPGFRGDAHGPVIGVDLLEEWEQAQWPADENPDYSVIRFGATK
jgi:hypothetical protein